MVSVPSFVSTQTILSACLAALKLVLLCIQVILMLDCIYVYIKHSFTPTKQDVNVNLHSGYDPYSGYRA